jgi:carboxypeptidase C (cathepsin A)
MPPPNFRRAEIAIPLRPGLAKRPMASSLQAAMRFHFPILPILLAAGTLSIVRGFAAEEIDAKDPAPPAVEEKQAVVREGRVTIAGKAIDYEVITDTLTLKKEDGSPRASVFHVSYLRKDIKDDSTRPVLFAFNGGPGSSAVWLHLGTLGPKRVDLPGDGTLAPKPPARLVDNEFSILDVADLVFVDPVSTGYSRLEKHGKPEEFHGVDGDVESLADFIRRWITEHQRWDSPKFLLGESYGGIRVSGLADELQSRFGMSLNGVVLLSSLIDFRTLSPSHGNDLAYLCFLPTFTAVAHYHGKIQGDRDDLVAEARAFANGEYAAALLAGTTLDPQRKTAVASRLEKLTSIPAATFLENHLRLSPTRFRGELLRSEGKVIGRFDARVAWPTSDSSSASAGYDPSFSLALGAYSTTMLDYLGEELGWKEDSPYEILTGKVHPWNWGAENSYLNMSPSLVSAMVDNPHLRILVMGGHADLATPLDGILHSIHHMHQLSPEARSNISVVEYEAGHMFYLNPPDLEKGRKDLVEFINKP